MDKLNNGLKLNKEENENEINKLKEEINNNKNENKKLTLFLEDAKKTISIVGEGIRNSIESTDNQEEALITISKVIHAARYNLSSTASIEDVAKYTDCSSDEVESSMKLIKRINKKISNK